MTPTLLQLILDNFPEFLTDEPVNGADLVEFIANYIKQEINQ